jgi:hypothetical protein
MFSKSIFTAAALGAVGLAGLGAAVWIQPSLAQGQQPPAEAPNPAAEANNAASRETVMNSKKILLAAHNYHSTNNYFPPPAIVGKGGQPLLSWRVALLPYLAQEDLYREFRLDEPWDSPHNRALIDRMPAVFESPEAPAPKGQTRFRGFAGQGTIFDPNPPKLNPQGKPRGPGVEVAEILDGTSNTIFLALARDATVWTKPGELPYIAGQELPALDESNPRGSLVALCDGSVHRLSKVGRSVLPLMFTYQGGESVPQDWNRSDQQPAPAPATPPPPTAPAPAPTPTAAPTPAPTSSPSVEQRLQRLEEKVDRLLEKLEAGKP